MLNKGLLNEVGNIDSDEGFFNNNVCLPGAVLFPIIVIVLYYAIKMQQFRLFIYNNFNMKILVGMQEN